MDQQMSYLSVESMKDRLIWRLHRPERANGLGSTLAAQFLDACHTLTDDDERILIVTAEPLVKNDLATWIGGGDLKELALFEHPAEAAAYAAQWGAICAKLSQIAMPVIAAIDGAAIGGGAELALWCDERLMTARSLLEFRQLKAGLPCGYGSTKRLCDLIGLARAQQLVYGCAKLDANEAQALGLCTSVVTDATALAATVDASVARWQSLPFAARRAQKKMFWGASNLHPGSCQLHERQLFQQAWGNPHHRQLLERYR